MSGVTTAVWDAVASVCEDLTGITHVYAAGVTPSVLYDGDLVTPLQDDFIEAGLPAVVVMLGPHSAITGHGQTRMTYEFRINVWAYRQPLGDQTALLADAIDELYRGFEQHSKAKLHAEDEDYQLQSALITGGRGIEARQAAAAENQPDRVFLVAPLTAQVKVDVSTSPQPE